MREQTYIRLHDASADQVSWLVKAPGQAVVRQLQTGSLEEIPAELLDSPVIVFAPADAVLMVRADVPTRNRARLQKAVPYALEDQLIDDVDELHFSLGQVRQDNVVDTAIVSNTVMDTWLSRFKACGITVDKIYPAQLALPLEQHRWTALVDDTGLCTVRTSAMSGFACDSQNLIMLLQRAMRHADSVPSAIDVINCSSLSLEKQELEKDLGLNISTVDCNGDALVAYSRAEMPELNLLQGNYSNSSAWQSKTRRWWPAAAVFALWLVVGGAMQTYDYVRLSNQAADYQAQIEKTYRSVFPNSKNSGNAYRQLKQKLDQLSGSTPASEDFLALLGQSGNFLRQAKGMEITTLSYRNGRIDIDVAFTDTKALTALRQRFSSLKGLQIEVQSTSLAGNKVKSRLRITGLPS